jgi:peptidoglycan/LPS O-acetylase OafA/YrhL
VKKLTVLEALRGFASVYVAFGHYILSFKHIPNYLSLFFRFGQEAVIIFFILSGFVIYYSSEKNGNEPLSKYFIKRIRRIYFPLICAFAVSLILVGQGFSFRSLIGNILMLQDFETGKPGNIVGSFMGNAPLWSLSYEWIFYLLFPFVYPVIKNLQNRGFIVGAFSIVNLIIYILFPNHIFLVLSYFIIWWTGLEIGAYILRPDNKSNIKNLIICYLVALVILTTVCISNYCNSHSIKLGIYPYLILRHFCFAFFCLLMAIYQSEITKRFTNIIKPFAAVAPISYAIYIFHYPILVQSKFGMAPAYELSIKIVLLLVLAYTVEIILQPKVNKILR